MLILLFALAAESVAMPPPHKLTGPVNTLFSADDYPKEAARHGWQGTVVADLTVSVGGQVIACSIVQSSGYAVLDAKTCEILRTRARFIPAKDSEGRPTVDVLRTPPIMWHLSR
jgi:protein TonB